MPGINVPFEEHEDSPSESGGRDGDFQFTRVFVTNYEDRWAFLRGMFTGGVLGLPMAFSPDWPTVFADTFTIARIVNDPIAESITNPATQSLRHRGKALITINYKVVATEELITYEQQESGEFITVPSRGLKWLSSGQALDADLNPAYPTSTTRHIVTMMQVVDPPWITMSQMLNCVNSVAFYVPVTRQVFPPGSLLFAERNASVSLSFDGRSTFKVGLTFLEKQQKQWHNGITVSYGWNYQWNAATGAFDMPVNAITGAPTFNSADLASIFTSHV